MKAFCVPFIVHHSHPPFISLSGRKTRVVKKSSGNSKHRESQCNESCVDSHSVRLMGVIHQELVLFQERRLVHNGKQKVEAREIGLNLFPIGSGQI